MVLGARDMVVIATYDGILVSDKHQSSYMKPLVDQVHQRPMYERKRWGEYRVMDSLQYENGTQVLTKRLSINAGKALSYQVHKHRKEVWTIIKGKGTMLIDGKEFAVKTGDVIEIPIGTRHALFALSELEFIEVQIGSPLVEEDIERLEENWHSMY